MDALLAIVVLFIWLGVAAYHRLSIRWGLGVSFILLLFYGYSHVFGKVGFIILWAIWAIIGFLACANSLRVIIITKRFMRWFNRRQPVISQTEKQVLEAGGLWWEKQFFTGSPKWSALFKMEKPSLREDEQRFLDDQVNTL